MELSLEIETQDKVIGSSWSLNTIERPTNGVEIKYLGPRLTKSFGIPEALCFIVHLAETVDLALASAAIYEKFNGKSINRIVINRRTVTNITKEGIQQVIKEEKIRIWKE
jgi:hypothetical protein